MYAVEGHARKWVQREAAESDALSEWFTSIGSLVKDEIHVLTKCRNL